MAKATKKSARSGSKKSSKKSARTKRAGAADATSRGFLSTEKAHTGRALSGKSAKAAAFNPAQASVMAAVAAGPDPALAYDRPRPSPTRYPIDMDKFVALKSKIEESKAKVAKPGSNVIADKSKKGGPATVRAGLVEAGVPLAAGPEAAAPAMLANFAGIGATGWLPPDCTMATGPAHVLLSVNATVAIYNKAGGAPVKQATLTTWFSNVISNAKIFDPKALYDQHAGRWLLLAVALGPGANESWFLLSISKTSDPLGGWFNYKLNAKLDGSTATTNWADYPALGVDNVAVYITANMFSLVGSGSFQYSKLRVIKKAGPYAGGALTYFDFVNLKNADNSTAFTIQPCHTYGAPGAEFLVNSVYPSATGTQNKLTLWKVLNGGGVPSLSKVTITTSPFSLPPDAIQQGGGTPLDTGDTRVLNAVFRGGSVWCALTTAQNWGAGNRAACHWFQLNSATGALTQQGVYGAGGFDYFYPAVAPDSNGNMVMVFSRSGASEFASIRYTGRKSAEPLGQLQGSALLKAGVANYTGLDGFGRNRWGDYAGIANDPADTLKTWFYSMYANPSNKWATQVGASKF